MSDLISRHAMIQALYDEAYLSLEKRNALANRIDRIPTAEPNHDGFLEFLFNAINPNEMEQYIAMYNSKGVAEDGRFD